ncbi:MAG: DciA family protein [Sideroxyarcus sp.]|nr:DciA family protein [Sideroxyarcus sp.]
MPHRLKAFLDSNQGLRHLSQRAKQIALLQRHYQLLAPPSLLPASRVMQLHGQTLILAADNGAVAAKLRQISTELISLFRTRGCEVTGIQIRVQVRVKTTPTTPVPRILGNSGRKELENLALNLQDSPLKTALRRLAKRAIS